MKAKSLSINAVLRTAFMVFCTLCIQACYDDKGNYDYQDIDEIKISGLEESYAIGMGDPITIKPVIKSSIPGNEEDYTYEWVWLHSLYKDVLRHTYVWSTLKEWEDFTFGLPAGKYSFFYRVKDKRTGVTWSSKPFVISVLSDLNKGFFILSDVNEVGRVDYVNYYIADDFVKKIDILTSIGTELPPLNKPLGVACFPDPNSPTLATGTANGYMTAVISENGTYKLHPTTLEYIESYNMVNAFVLKSLLPGDFYIKKIINTVLNNSSMAVLDNKDNIYFSYTTGRVLLTANSFVNVNSVSKEKIRISPILVNTSAYLVVMYDLDSKSFVRKVDANTMASRYYSAGNETLFKFNSTGMDLIYMHSANPGPENFNSDSGQIYVVLKDPTTNKLHFCSFYPNAEKQMISQEMNIPQLDIKGFTMAINQRQVANVFGLLYLHTDNEIYMYDHAYNDCQLVYTAPAGHKISKIDFMKSGWQTSITSVENFNNLLMVCTYDPNKAADSCGTLEIMRVMALGEEGGTFRGALTPYKYKRKNGDEKLLKWDGFGKIVDVAWKNK